MKGTLTEYDISAIIGWWRCSNDLELVACLANISAYFAKRIIENYMDTNL